MPRTDRSTTAAPRPEPSRRTGGRSAKVINASLQAALDELAEVGYADFSVARVASRAGVHQTTIYRRWTRKEDLIAAACMRFADEALPVPDLGSLEADLRFAITNIARFLESRIGRTLISIGLSAAEAPESLALSTSLWEQRIGIGQAVFDAAIARGEWNADFDREAVFAELIGPLLAHSLILNHTITATMIETRVKSILAMR